MSNSQPFAYLVYPLILFLIWLLYLGRSKWSERKNLALLEEVTAAGLTEPASLHPVIDPNKCLGCGACARACPEGDVLGLVGGKAEMIEATNCIGHGACRRACPFDAITLVFGTETRGVDIPEVDPDFQTNVPGLFIAGELGGMGLIRNAIEQGAQAARYAGEVARKVRHAQLDMVIIGAGPAGIAASLAAKQQGLRSVTLEQESFGGTVAHFPRNKVVMTAPARLPIIGPMKFREVSKEDLLSFWSSALQEVELPILYGERVERITPLGSEFEVMTAGGRVLRSATVLLALGRRGSPRKLGVPGEGQPKVHYRLVDPQQFRGRHVLVVGGGDSALEAALSLEKERGTTVTLSYRSGAFTRAKPKNRKRVEAAEAAGRIAVYLGSNVTQIGERDVDIECGGKPLHLANDAVIVCAGGVLPMGFLRDIGINVETKHGTA